MTIIRTGNVLAWCLPIMRIIALLSIWLAASAHAHEVVPAIADFTVADGKLTVSVDAPVEGLISGVDMSAVADTNASPVARDYDALRALPPVELESRFNSFWPDMASRLRLAADGDPLTPELVSIKVSDVPDLALPRPATLVFAAEIPPGARNLTAGWDKAFGTLVLRQQGVDQPYTGFLEAGALSEPIALGGGGQVGALQSFFDYIPVGFDHILPKGLDHILFVLGLFFFSTRLRPLLWQITPFTVAHTVTLALSSLGYITLPARIVEPLIAASIVFVAVENVWGPGYVGKKDTAFADVTPWRPVIVFCFGLVHGLGFASVLSQFGLPEGAFFPALIGFNIGVELGQLTIVAGAALLLWTWAARHQWYRNRIAVPASIAIAAVGAYWVVERTLL